MAASSVLRTFSARLTTAAPRPPAWLSPARAIWAARLRPIALALCIAPFTAAPAAAGPCRLALVLGMDISSSVDAREDALQRGGLAAALRHPDVVAAILSQPDRPVALAMFEWSGRIQQDMILPWTMLSDTAAITEAADRIAQSPRSYEFFATAIGRAAGFAHDLFATGPACDARVLDLSGDGVNNDSITPAQAYATYDFSAITVNALAIEVTEPGTDHALDDGAPDGLTAYFRDHVIHGPGAFVQTAQGFADFERAMTRKLLRELEIQIGLDLPR